MRLIGSKQLAVNKLTRKKKNEDKESKDRLMKQMGELKEMVRNKRKYLGKNEKKHGVKNKIRKRS